MTVRHTHLSVVLVGILTCLTAFAQQSAPTADLSGAVPPLVNFASTLTDINSKPIVGVTGVTFLLYKDQQGGSALWMETQTVTTDENGHYSVTLGAGSPTGLPANLFVAGESRWLAVQPHGETEQARILLLSVPYALKAGDAATVGGLPASAFMLANSGATAGKSSNSIPSAAPSAAGKASTPVNPAVTGKGTLNFIPMWDSASDIINSLIFQKGAGIGISTATPAASLDVNGRTDIRDALTLFPKGTDNALLLSGTNFKVTSTGLVTFVAGQTFPGTGKGTITGVMTTAGSGLSGGGATGTLSLKVPAAGITNAMLQNSKVTLNATAAGGLTAPGAMTLGSTYTIGLKTCSSNQVLQYSGTAWNCATIGGTGTITGVTAGTDLTGGGTTGSVTLNVDTTKVPQLAAANTFLNNQSITGNLNVTGTAFQPVTVQSSNGFGTWLALGNSSAGGHTWNIISAGGGNAEGAGNFGISDLTGKSTIWLEGNTNTTNLTASGSSGASIVDADVQGANAGTPTPGLRFGGAASGEGIASNRAGGLDAFGLDFYTEFASRMLIAQDGRVGIGTIHPVNQLEVDSASNGYASIFTQGGAAPAGSGQNGSDGIDAYGNSGDGAGEGGSGGLFSGGGAGASGLTGEGIVVFGGTDACSEFGCFAVNYAGDFQGSIFVKDGSYQPSASTFIDHPVDPANKYLMHSSVQSPDMKNIYDGVATLDAGGEAVIQMPEWFGALNRDFRYQLTCIGGFAPVYIAGELANNQFKIGGGREGMKISWQVTGIRQDAWANAHRTPVELEKPDREKGFYLNPELYGASQEQGVAWARNPEMMKQRLAAQLHSADAQTAPKAAVHATSVRH